MILKSLRNGGASNDQLRESYRKRLDEIFSSPATDAGPEEGDFPSFAAALDEPDATAVAKTGTASTTPAREPATVSTTPAPDPVSLGEATTRIAQSLTACLSTALQEIEQKTAGEAGKRAQTLESALEAQSAQLATVTATLAQSAEVQMAAAGRIQTLEDRWSRIAASLAQAAEIQTALREHVQAHEDRLAEIAFTAAQTSETHAANQGRLASQDEWLARLEAAIAKSAGEQASTQALLSTQAEKLVELTGVIARLAESSQGMQARLDTHAEALRQFNARTGAQQNMLENYKAAVERLRDIATQTTIPMTLPDDL